MYMYVSQIYILYDKLDMVDVDGVVKFIQSLQRADGSFTGDKWGMCSGVVYNYIPYIGYISTHGNSRVSNTRRLKISDTRPRVIQPCIV